MSALSFHFRQSFTGMTSWAKVLLLAALILLFMLLGTVISMVLAIPIFGLSMSELYQAIGYPTADTIGILKYFQIVQTIFLFLIPSLLAAFLYSGDTAQYLMARKTPAWLTLMLVAGSLVLSIPLMNVLTEFNASMKLPIWMEGIETRIRSMEETAGKLTDLFLNGKNYSDLSVNLLMIAILPALGEEFLFRGVVQRLFSEMTGNRHLGIWIAAFVFSFFHFQFYGFLPRFLLGLYFGYLLFWSSSIWVPVTAHFINNGLAVVYYHFSKAAMGETAMDKLGIETGGHASVYLSVFFTSLVIGLIYLKERERKISAG